MHAWVRVARLTVNLCWKKRKPAKEKITRKNCFAIWRRNCHAPAAQSLANSPRWNLHLSCSSVTALMFQQPNLWQTRHAGTSTCHVPASQYSCSSSPISGKLVTLEPPLVMFQRHNTHVPAAQSLAHSSRWSLHLSCSNTTMLMFQQPYLWQTRHAGTSTCHVPAPQCSCSSSPISGKLATLEPSPALAFIKLINVEGWMSEA